jgi:hypothetical protein
METTYTIEFMRPAEPTIAPIKQPSAFHVAYYCNLPASRRLHWIINRSLRVETVRTPDDCAFDFNASLTASPMNFSNRLSHGSCAERLLNSTSDQELESLCGDRMVRPVWHAHLLQNELLQEIVSFLSAHSVCMANHRGDGVDERLRDGSSDFGWKPAEVVALFRAEGDRVIAVVVDPVTGPDLTILAVARRNAVSFGLWEVLPN